MGPTKDSILMLVQKEPAQCSTKVSIVGTGQVGLAVIYSILNQRISTEIALVDVMVDKNKGEMMDFQHGLPFLVNGKIIASNDYSVTENSKVCIIAAGVRQKDENESRLSLVQRNVEVFKNIVPPLAKHSPNAIILVISNPVDIMTHVTWKLSGFPVNRVMGSGTTLDTSRFRYFISERLNVAPSAVQGYVIGEHGDSSVPVWSSVSVGGVKLMDVAPKIGQEDDPEKWADVHKDVVRSAYTIIKYKMYTNWGIGICAASIVGAIIRNERTVWPVSTLVKNLHGNEKEVFLSVPCIVGENGVQYVLKQPFKSNELKGFMDSIDTVSKVTEGIKF